MAKLPRGGKRSGAGRPLILSAVDKLCVGALVQHRLRKKTQAAFDRSIRQKHSEDNLEALWRRLNEIPVPVRQRLRRKWEAEHPGEAYDAQLDDSEIGSLLAEIRGAIEEGGLQGRRYFAAPERATKDALKQVLRVMTRAGRRCGLAITERMAKSCLDQYRASLKEPSR